MTEKQKCPCPACPVEVRGLYAVAFNLLNLRSDPDRWQRKIGERLDELERAVALMTPIVDAHFGDSDAAMPEKPTVDPKLARLRELAKAAYDIHAYGDSDRLNFQADTLEKKLKADPSTPKEPNDRN